MKILSIQVGMPKSITYNGMEITTGIFKSRVEGPVMLRLLHLEGDGQADLRVHGGRDKALYAYSEDAYPEWRALRPGDTFDGGAMGENVLLDEAREDRIYVGDTFDVGEATVQVTEPRFPCFKLAAKFGDPNILRQFMRLARPGVYFRVLREGRIAAGDSFRLVAQEKTKLSVQELFLMKGDADALDPARIRELLTIQALTPQWRERLEGWLERHS